MTSMFHEYRCSRGHVWYACDDALDPELCYTCWGDRMKAAGKLTVEYQLSKAKEKEKRKSEQVVKTKKKKVRIIP